MVENSRFDQSGRRRPAIFRFREKLQDNKRSDLACAYIGPELLFMINGFLELWNVFFEESTLGYKKIDNCHGIGTIGNNGKKGRKCLEFTKIVESLKMVNQKLIFLVHFGMFPNQNLIITVSVKK